MKTLVATILVAALGLPWAVAGEPEKKKAKEKKEQEKQEVITNETLKKKFGEPEPAAAPKKADKGEAAPKATPPAPASAEPDPALRIAELKKEEQRIRRRIKSLKNPFLPRVPPTEEESKAEEGKGADERVQMLEKRLVEIKDELKKLEKPPGRTG